MSLNPELMNPGQDPSQPTVQAIVAITQPLPIEKADSCKYYYNTIPSASMHRKDGKKLAFVFGFLATDDKYDQEYLDYEIAVGIPYVRYAKEDEIYAYHMRTNPRKTIENEMRPELEDRIRNELETKIRAEMTGISGSGGQDSTGQIVDTSTGTAASIVPIIPMSAADQIRNKLTGIVGSDVVAEGAAGSGV